MPCIEGSKNMTAWQYVWSQYFIIINMSYIVSWIFEFMKHNVSFGSKSQLLKGVHQVFEPVILSIQSV